VSADDGIAKARRRIDEIDGDLVRLLSERARCALEIGRIKRAHGMPVYDPERERQIVEKVVAANAGPLGADAMRRLYERVLDESRRLERLAAEGAGPEGKTR